MGQTKTASTKGASKASTKGGSKTQSKGASKSSASKSGSKGATTKASTKQEQPTTGLDLNAVPSQEQVDKSNDLKNQVKDELNIPSTYRDVNIHENNPDLAAAQRSEAARKLAQDKE